jgi:hypothetical protein
MVSALNYETPNNLYMKYVEHKLLLIEMCRFWHTFTLQMLSYQKILWDFMHYNLVIDQCLKIDKKSGILLII